VPLPARSERRPQNIAGVSNLFAGIAECLLMALRDISLGCRIGSLSEQSGPGPTCCRLNSVGNDPKRT
jgi:hypothetical protein